MGMNEGRVREDLMAEEMQDLICVGFGPASLAIAIALDESLGPDKSINGRVPKVRFLERQHQFAWHAGMLLPGSRMQISFLKDLATLRNPQSAFTFVNYLKHHNRLVQFSNLGTFLPSRAEFQDYMHWCADHFQPMVDYDQEVIGICPNEEMEPSSRVDSFSIMSRCHSRGSITLWRARNVIIAVGGTPHIPPNFPTSDRRVIHSSQYASSVKSMLPDDKRDYKIAIVGSGQSAAEIFHDLHRRYPAASSTLIIRDTALRPSDDSPFVNEIFNPERASEFYDGSAGGREQALRADKSTNYSVVRLELLEQIYHGLYQQRIKHSDESQWQHRILASRQVTHTRSSAAKNNETPGTDLILTLQNINPLSTSSEPDEKKHDEETLTVDAVFLATGYVRSAHEALLSRLEHLRPSAHGAHWRVRKDYKVEMDGDRVSPEAGIWLQGCNESTHGLSDTLLSTLATRAGEVVESIFGSAAAAAAAGGTRGLKN